MSSEGSKDAVEDERDLERRYHSSGTQKRKCLEAEGLRGFALRGLSRTPERLVLKGTRVDSMDDLGFRYAFEDHRSRLTLTVPIRPYFF